MFELLLVVAAHYRPWLKPTFLMFGCMLIAGVAGLLYARDLARGLALGALGGGCGGRLVRRWWRWRRPISWATGPIFIFPGA